MKKKLFHLIIMALIIIMVIYSKSAVEYVQSAMTLCYEIIIPTLFPFFVCSGLLIYSGFSETLARIFQPVMRPLFGINENGAGAFVLGLLSGYPLGAVTACQLYESRYISKGEAERLLAFCNNSGPLFIMGAVGASMYSGIKTGLMLYGAHVLAAVSVGIIFRFYKTGSHNAPKCVIDSPERSLGEVFGMVMQNSIKNILTVCATIIFFSCVSRVCLDMVPRINDFWYAVASGILEFSTGTAKIAVLDIDTAAKLVITSVIVGFSGISVHVQVMGVTAGYGLSLKPYIGGKVLHGIFAGVYMWIMLKLMPDAVETFAGMPSGGTLAGASIVVLTACVILFMGFLFGKRGIKSEKNS